MGVKLSEMTADTSVAGTEKLLVLDGTTTKTMTVDYVVAYAIDELIASTSASPATGDYLLGYNGTTEHSFALNDVSDYALDYVWGSVTEADPSVGGDMFLAQRSGTMYTVDIDTIKTYCATGIQASVLNLSGLNSATLDSTDLFAVCEGTTARKVALSDLETKLWTDFATYTAALSAASAGADADKLYVLQSGVPKYLTLTLLSDYVVAEILAADSLTADVLGGFDAYVIALSAQAAPTTTDLFYVLEGGTTEKKVALSTLMQYIAGEVSLQPWTAVDASRYSTTPASTSTITMYNTDDFEVGYPVRYQYDGSVYYGIVTAVNANALLTIAGAPLNGSYPLQNLYVGRPERVVNKHIFIDTPFAAAAQDILSTVTYERMRWEMAKAYLVTFAATSGTVDTGASQPKINVRVAGNLVSTNDSNSGLTLSGTAGTWTANSAVAVSTSAYDITRGDAIDVRCTSAGTNGDAECLSVELTFVLE